MNLVIDVGNSYIKAAIFKNKELLEIRQFVSGFEKEIHELINSHPGISQGILCETGKPEFSVKEFLKDQFAVFLELDAHTALPIENLYKTRESLGKDRIAGAVGANDQFPNTDILIIDTGTAITFDFVNDKNQFAGGSISPGLNMRYQALHKFTDKLPLLSPVESGYTNPADQTEGSIHAGIISGILYEIKGVIKYYRQQYPLLQMILTGGDAIFFEKMLKNSIFVDPNLVIKGLNKILRFNA